MLKWFGRFIFIMFVFVATVPVLRYAEYSRLEAFYKDSLKGNENDSEVYLIGISTMFGMDYIEEESLIDPVNSTGNHQFDLYVHRLGVTENKVPLNGLMVYINNIEIMENGQIVEDPIIMIAIELSINSIKNASGDFVNRDEVIVDPKKTFAIPMLFIADTDGYLLKDDVYADITRIEISYSNRALDDDGDYTFNSIFLATIQSSSDPAFVNNPALIKISEFSITQEEYQLRSLFVSDKPTDDEIEAFGLMTDKLNITKYNWVIWRTVILYSLVVVVFAYFMFFHKKVMEKRRSKDYVPRPKDGSVAINEPIFKEHVETDKGGK
jgi:hypothetical protein